MAEITVETLVEIRKPYADKLAKQREGWSALNAASLVHEGMVGIVARIDRLEHRVSQGGCAGPRREKRTRVETRVMVVWERSAEQGGGTWTAYYPLSALKIVK